MSQNLLPCAGCACTLVCVCVHLSQNIIAVSEYVLLWIPLPATLFVPLFHKPVCLLSEVRWHIMFPYLSAYLTPFLSFIPLFRPGIPVIIAHGLQSPDAIGHVISELMPHFCTIPMTICLVKLAFLPFQLSHKEQADRKQRDASVLYYNVLICFYFLYYKTLKKALSVVLMHYRCRRMHAGNIYISYHCACDLFSLAMP